MIVEGCRPGDRSPGCEGLWIPPCCTSRDELDIYAEYVQRPVTELAMRHSCLVAIGTRGRSWWSTRVANAVDSYKNALRTRARPEKILVARQRRNRVVRMAKIV